MENIPKVSVLMPVYNGALFLRSAIESILNQSFVDLELLIIDDGSTDSSADIIHSFDDLRIRYIKNEENLGIVKSLNKGLTLARGIYIARMDADDISLPQRLQRQVDFLDANPETGICGSNAITIDSEGNRQRLWFYAEKPENVLISRTFVCPFLHPTIMARKEILTKVSPG